MKKSEVNKLGRWPVEFLNGLVSEVPDIKISSAIKLKWRCEIHGEYEQAISEHLKTMRCPKCSKEESALKIQKSRLSKTKYSAEFLKDLELSPDKEAVLTGKLRRNDKARFVCPIHGEYLQRISGHMEGKSCPKCRYLKSSLASSESMRSKNPYPQWFIKDLEGSPDKEDVLNGILKSHDKAQFYCSQHGFYIQLIYDHLYGKGCPTCASNFSSTREKFISEFLSSEGIKVIRNDRNILSDCGGYEIDLYLPDYKVAFEFNGYLFHCSGSKTEYGYGGKPKYYHQLKTELCLQKGIKLYHIWEDCSDELCLSIVKVKLGLCERIYARKCLISSVSKEIEREFLNNNHCDGYTQSVKNWALSLEGEIVCVLSLRRSFTGYYEIARFATKAGYEVVGGYSRLLNQLKEYLKSIGVKELITYCNRDLSPDSKNNFYSNNGFLFEGESSLIMNYYSIRATDVCGRHYKAHEVVSRFSLRKQVLIEELGDRYKENMNELECAELLGFRPVYNSGNFKYRILL